MSTVCETRDKIHTLNKLSLESQIGEEQSVEKEGQEMTQKVAKDSVDTD